MKFLPTAFCAALLSIAALVAAPAAQAQVNVNVGPPAWGPAVPAGTQFYYIPEIDGYYDLYAQQYIVFQNGQWVPVQVVNGYDPYGFHPVILDYRGRQPWMYVRDHRARYPRTVVVVPQRRGLPPGQARKLYREGYQQGRHDDRRDNRGNGNNGNGHGRRH
jgi:hypothetical protein